MSQELWRRTLETLRGQFESGAQGHPHLRCVLIHAGPGEQERIRERPVSAPEGMLQPGGHGAYREASTPEACTGRAYYYIGEKTGADRFNTLAEGAGRSLQSAPEHAVKGIPPECLNTAHVRQRWLWSLFELAWQGRPESALSARRLIWHGGATYAYDTEKLKGLYTSMGMRTSFLREWTEQLPDYFCSELGNVMLASAYAINTLLDTEDNLPGPAHTARPGYGSDSMFEECYEFLEWLERQPNQCARVKNVPDAFRDADLFTICDEREERQRSHTCTHPALNSWARITSADVVLD